MKKWLVVNYDGTKAIIEWNKVVRFDPEKYRNKYMNDEYFRNFEYAVSFNEYSSKNPLWIAGVTEEEASKQRIIVNRLDFPKDSDIDFKLIGRHMTWEDEPVEIK